MIRRERASAPPILRGYAIAKGLSIFSRCWMRSARSCRRKTPLRKASGMSMSRSLHCTRRLGECLANVLWLNPSDLQIAQVGDAGFHHAQVHFDEIIF